jgi:hypothetical protein
LDQPDVVKVLDENIRAGLWQLRPAEPLGDWLRGALERGDHARAWDILLSSLANAISEPGRRKWIAARLTELAEKYASKGFWKRIGTWAMERTGAKRSEPDTYNLRQLPSAPTPPPAARIAG